MNDHELQPSLSRLSGANGRSGRDHEPHAIRV